MIESIRSAVFKAYTLAKPYWTSDRKATAWILLLLMATLQGAQVYLAAVLSYAYADIFDLLDARDFDAISQSVAWFFSILAFLVIANVAALHVRYVLTINWRQYLTDSYFISYFSKSAFNQVEQSKYKIDNPDQRIAEDINTFVTRTLSLGNGLLSNFGSLIAFSFILWTVSGDLPIPVGGRDITIPGYMFWVAVIYAAITTWITHITGKRLIPLKIEQQQVEADFRFHLARVREYSDSIALTQGGAREHRDLTRDFSMIKANWLHLLKFERRVLGITLGFSHLSGFFPYLAALPALMAGTIAIGGLMQLSQAFGSVYASLFWFARMYSNLATWKASLDRITLLDAAMKEANNNRSSSKIDCIPGGEKKLCISDLTITTPSSDVLFEQQSFQIAAGENTIVTGPTGSGKSTLFQAIAGHWLHGAGRIQLPVGKMEFLPQTAYLPKGSLRAVLAYPGQLEDHSTEEFLSALRKCKASHLMEQLDEPQDWARTLSGGEKQRLSIARVVLSRPDWLFMDESTSAIDPATENELLTMLFEELPSTTFVSITHREPAASLYCSEIRLNRDLKLIEVAAGPAKRN
ncbi:MAG: ABC transporter ATP-binding protein/permease [Verrucomicrobiota bacterium]